MTDEVKFTDAQWDALAQAAEAFADMLDKEQHLLGYVLSTNWAGACDEGVGIIENLRSALRGDADSFLSSITSEATYLRDVAKLCVDSKSVLAGLDAENSGDFSR